METQTTTKTNIPGYHYTYNQPQQGWECPRCGRINAPWVSQCPCSGGDWKITWTSDHIDIGDKPNWWEQVTCGDDNVLKNPVTYNNVTNPNNCHTPHYSTPT